MMCAFIKKGTLEFQSCTKHGTKFPTGSGCPACAQASGQRTFRIRAEEGLDYVKCPLHGCSYLKGDECPKCAKERIAKGGSSNDRRE
jgi:Zn ribbon nucleic-acid-binding protein